MKRGHAERARPRKKIEEDLPSDLFPATTSTGSGRLVMIMVVAPILFCLGIYFCANGGAYAVEAGWIEPGGSLHWTLCMGLDIGKTFGLDFTDEHARAACGMPVPLVEAIQQTTESAKEGRP